MDLHLSALASPLLCRQRGISALNSSQQCIDFRVLLSVNFIYYCVCLFIGCLRPGGCAVFLQLTFKSEPRFSFCWKLVHNVIPWEVGYGRPNEFVRTYLCFSELVHAHMHSHTLLI